MCRIKNKNVKFGGTVDKNDIGKVICQLNFSRLEPTRAFLGCVERLVKELPDRCWIE